MCQKLNWAAKKLERSNWVFTFFFFAEKMRYWQMIRTCFILRRHNMKFCIDVYCVLFCWLFSLHYLFLFWFSDWREMAAESIYKERCIPVNDGQTWAKYMLISGSPDDEYDIITLQYTEEGLLSVDENREGRAAAFGDDIAIECLSTEFKREIYVVRNAGTFNGDSKFLFHILK